MTKGINVRYLSPFKLKEYLKSFSIRFKVGNPPKHTGTDTAF